MKWICPPALIVIAISCLFQISQNDNKQKGGIIFTFDDQYIDEWHNFREKFKEYDIKATFFISRPQNLTPCQIYKLRQLVEDGHEIGCHGFNHRDAIDYKDSPLRYYSEEIKPAMEILEDTFKLEIKSFAYPFGNSTEKIDSLLLIQIPYLRKAIWNINDTTIDYYDNIFASADSFRIINSMGIDNNYGIMPENIETGIKRAQRNNEVLVLHSHRIDTSKNDYVVNPQFLEKIFQLSKEYGVKSIRVCDLENYFDNYY